MKSIFSSQVSIMEKLAELITAKLNIHLNKEGLELQKMKLGFEILLINITKFFIILIAAIKFNLLKESLIMISVFASIRYNAFGLHAKNSIICTITSLLFFVFGAYITRYLKFNNYTVLITFIIINFLLYKYAPADTENHPLLGADLRNKLKLRAVLVGVFFMIIALIIHSSVIKTLITLAAGFEVFTIIPITYFLLKRGYANYEKYERT